MPQEHSDDIPDLLLAALEAAPAGPSLKCVTIPVNAIEVPAQARKFFDEEFIERLAEAIRDKDQPWPMKVRRGCWELVAGTRRLRACKLAGLTELVAIQTTEAPRRGNVRARTF